jgi:hypothetical protein
LHQLMILRLVISSNALGKGKCCHHAAAMSAITIYFWHARKKLKSNLCRIWVPMAETHCSGA